MPLFALASSRIVNISLSAARVRFFVAIVVICGFSLLVTGDKAGAKRRTAPAAPPPQYPNIAYDFDGDGKADTGRWHPANAEFKVRNSGDESYTTVTIGSSSSKPVPGDYDGDTQADIGVFTGGSWNIQRSAQGTLSFNLGTTGDIPACGDFDGDGTTDAAVFRPGTPASWLIRYSDDGATTSINYGTTGDISIPGDYDGDGTTDIAVYRPTDGDWHINGSSSGHYTFHWGIAIDVPVQGDFDVDGISDPAVYRPTTGTWYVAKSSTGFLSSITQVWGNWADQPTEQKKNGVRRAIL